MSLYDRPSTPSRHYSIRLSLWRHLIKLERYRED
ncbi:hypothetical protein BVRB_6g152430 [Beta vulgaris subsp. vulgaris]|nr:hypothetical protein BVRB_6g152430 [Beta vulgaris subsp. vulgaris]